MVNGTLIECGDDEGLANAFIELYQDKAKMVEFGKVKRNYFDYLYCRSNV
jgi:hypothetical protein